MKRVLRSLALAGALTGAVAFAQGGMGGGDMGGGGGRGGRGGGDASEGGGMEGMPRAQRQSKADIAADKLHLNKEQKEKFAAIVSAAQEEMRPVTEQINQGRNVITTAILQGESGENMNKLMGQFTNLMVQRAQVEAKAYAKIYAMPRAEATGSRGRRIRSRYGWHIRRPRRTRRKGPVSAMPNRILVVLLAASSLAMAQGKKGGGGGGGNQGIPMMPGAVNKMDTFNQVLKLDKDQRKQVKTIMDDAQKEATPVRDEMEKAGWH